MVVALGVVEIGRGGGAARPHLRAVFRDQRLTVGDRYLVIIGMDLVEGEEAVASTAVVHESRLERGLHTDDLGEIDVPFKLFFGRCLDVKFF